MYTWANQFPHSKLPRSLHTHIKLGFTVAIDVEVLHSVCDYLSSGAISFPLLSSQSIGSMANIETILFEGRIRASWFFEENFGSAPSLLWNNTLFRLQNLYFLLNKTSLYCKNVKQN
jgi:hypothetical protein